MPFPVCLRGKLIQVKMFLYKLTDLYHFTIEENINYESENIYVD